MYSFGSFRVSRYPGCRCPPGYTGVHCELLKRAADENLPAMQRTSRGAASVFGIFVAVVLLAAVGAVAYKKLKRQNEEEKQACVNAANIEEEAENSQSEDDEEEDYDLTMEDIELL